MSTIAANNGTTMTVTDLFKKLPVRRIYISKGNRKNEDLKKIEHLIQSYAIIIPNLRISLFHNNKMVFYKCAAQELFQSITKVVEIASSILFSLNFGVGNASVNLWVPRYEATNRDLPIPKDDNGQFKVYLFMNRRPVSDKKLEKVLRKYLLLASSYKLTDKPLVSIMCVDTAKNEIDVNLDPNKNTVFLVKHLEILAACEEKLKEYYKCSLDEIEKKRQEIPGNKAKTDPANQSKLIEQSNAMFADNAFNESLNKDFDKLYKSRQPKAEQITNSIETRVNQSVEISVAETKTPAVKETWVKGYVAPGDSSIPTIPPVTHYKQPKITIYSSDKENKKFNSNSFIRQPEKRPKFDEEAVQDTQQPENPQINDMVSREMEELTRGQESIEEYQPVPVVPEKRRNATIVQFDMRTVTHHIRRKVEELERRKTDSGRRRAQAEQDAEKPKVLGQLSPSGYWVCSFKNGVHIINHHKLQEVVLYKRLLQSNQLPISQFSGHPLEIFEG